MCKNVALQNFFHKMNGSCTDIFRVLFSYFYSLLYENILTAKICQTTVVTITCDDVTSLLKILGYNNYYFTVPKFHAQIKKYY